MVLDLIVKSYLRSLPKFKEAAPLSLTTLDLWDGPEVKALLYIVRKPITDLHVKSHHYSLAENDTIYRITGNEQVMQLFDHGYVFLRRLWAS